MENIVIGKLVSNNALIIGKLRDKEIKDCLAIHISPGGTKKDPGISISLVPVLFPLSEDKVNISLNNILCTSSAPQDLVSDYLQKTSSLIMPKGTILS